MSQGRPRPRQSRKRRDKVRIMKPGSGYVQNPDYGMGMHSAHATPQDYWVDGEVPRDVPEPESIDLEAEEALTIRAHLKDAERLWEQGDFAQARVMANQLVRRQRRAAKYGLDFAPRILALLKEMDDELAQRRKAA